MAKLAVMMSCNEPDGAMSLHFGKAEWVMVVDPASRTAEFARNEGLNGRSAADLLICRGCTERHPCRHWRWRVGPAAGGKHPCLGGARSRYRKRGSLFVR